jgi:hypothetical protein
MPQCSNQIGQAIRCPKIGNGSESEYLVGCLFPLIASTAALILKMTPVLLDKTIPASSRELDPLSAFLPLNPMYLRSRSRTLKMCYVPSMPRQCQGTGARALVPCLALRTLSARLVTPPPTTSAIARSRTMETSPRDP